MMVVIGGIVGDGRDWRYWWWWWHCSSASVVTCLFYGRWYSVSVFLLVSPVFAHYDGVCLVMHAGVTLIITLPDALPFAIPAALCHVMIVCFFCDLICARFWGDCLRGPVRC